MPQQTKDSLRILLAEDDPLTLFVLQQRLADLGHQVVARANNGREAIRQNKLHNPDLVLMDVKMPGMDGIEAAKVIMAQTETPVVLITAYSDDDTVERAQQAGISAYLVKPVFDYQIKMAIQAACQQASGESRGFIRLD